MKQMKKFNKQLLILCLAFLIGSSGITTVRTGSIKTNAGNATPVKLYSVSSMKDEDGR